MPRNRVAPLVSIVMAIAATACATAPTPYAPAARAGGYGYSDTPIENDRYRVTFRTSSGGYSRASDMALLRAADLTLQRGYDWFAVTQRVGESAAGGESGP